MAGITQIPVPFVRLTNKPLDKSLTFDNVLEAREYINKTLTTKGAPYDGQIITVNSLCNSNNITANLQIKNTNNKNAINLIDAYNSKTKSGITGSELIIKETIEGKKYLLVFSHYYDSTYVPNEKDALLNCVNGNRYSILALAGVFASPIDNLIHFRVCHIDVAGKSRYISINQNIDVVGGKVTNSTSSNTTSLRITDVTNPIGISIFNNNTIQERLNSNILEVYIDVTDIL